MSNIKHYSVNGKVRYAVQLSPSFTVEANNLAEILKFLHAYGGIDEV